MTSTRPFQGRDDVDTAILEALVDRSEEGMTVFELRAAVDEDIDAIETALERLKSDGLIEVEKKGERTCIKPADGVSLDPSADGNRSVLDELRERLPF